MISIRGQFDKTFTRVIYKCSYCCQVVVSSGFSENKGLGGVLILAGSKNLVYSPWNDPDPEMIPNAEMIPKSTQKWYWPQNDPHFSSRRPRNDPQLILGMELYSVTDLLQVCCSVYVLGSHLTFHYSLCDFLALLSSNRLYVYFCIFNIILKLWKVLDHKACSFSIIFRI